MGRLNTAEEEASLLQDRPFSAAASVYISQEKYIWEAQTFSSISELRTRGQETLYETCACVINNSCIIIPLYETLHNRPFSVTSEESLRDSEQPDIFLLGARAPSDRILHEVRVYQTCACVIHINLTHCQLHVALVLSILHNVCAGYMCFVKL